MVSIFSTCFWTAVLYTSLEEFFQLDYFVRFFAKLFCIDIVYSHPNRRHVFPCQRSHPMWLFAESHLWNNALTKNKEYDLGIEFLAKKSKEQLEELLSTAYKNQSDKGSSKTLARVPFCLLFQLHPLPPPLPPPANIDVAFASATFLKSLQIKFAINDDALNNIRGSIKPNVPRGVNTIALFVDLLIEFRNKILSLALPTYHERVIEFHRNGPGSVPISKSSHQDICRIKITMRPEHTYSHCFSHISPPYNSEIRSATQNPSLFTAQLKCYYSLTVLI